VYACSTRQVPLLYQYINIVNEDCIIRFTCMMQDELVSQGGLAILVMGIWTKLFVGKATTGQWTLGAGGGRGRLHQHAGRALGVYTL
jgi:hypothetical protein